MYVLCRSLNIHQIVTYSDRPLGNSWSGLVCPSWLWTYISITNQYLRESRKVLKSWVGETAISTVWGTPTRQHYYLVEHLWKWCQKDWVMPVSLLPLTFIPTSPQVFRSTTLKTWQNWELVKSPKKSLLGLFLTYREMHSCQPIVSKLSARTILKSVVDGKKRGI